MAPQRAACWLRLQRRPACRCILSASAKGSMICAPSAPRISRKAWSVSRPNLIAALRHMLAIAILAVLPLHRAAAAEMLVLSDIHFNPTANKALVDQLAA